MREEINLISELNHWSRRFSKSDDSVKKDSEFVIKFCLSTFSWIFQEYYNFVRICQSQIISFEKIFVADSIIRFSRSDSFRSSTISAHWRFFHFDFVMIDISLVYVSVEQYFHRKFRFNHFDRISQYVWLRSGI